MYTTALYTFLAIKVCDALLEVSVFESRLKFSIKKFPVMEYCGKWGPTLFERSCVKKITQVIDFKELSLQPNVTH